MPPIITKSQDSKKIYMAEWLAQKPYDAPIKGYDQSYLNLCNKIYPIVRSFMMSERKDSGIPPIEFGKLITINLVSYLEDFVNEIGLWKAVTDENMRAFGKPLGIVPLSATYSTDDINKEDIHYLLWHYLMLGADKQGLLNVHNTELLQTAKSIYAVFDAALESEAVIATNLYEKYLTINDKTDFFAIKTKYDWVAFYSFLCNIDFSETYLEECEDIKAEWLKDGKPLPEAYYNQVCYNNLSSFFYTKNSSMAALPTREILAQILRTNGSMRQKIRDTWRYAHATCFVNTQIAKTLFEIQIIGTQQRLLFDTNTLPPQVQKNIVPKTTAMISLLKWGETYCVSGSFMGIGGVREANEKLANIKQNSTQSAKNNVFLDEAALANLKQMELQIRIAFEAYFGKPIVFTNTKQDIMTTYKVFIQWQNDNVPQKSDGTVDKEKSGSAAYWQKCADTVALRAFRANLLDISDHYMAIIPDVGFIKNTLVGLHKVPLFTQKGHRLTQEEEDILFTCIADGHPIISDYLLNKYGFSAFGFGYDATPEKAAHLVDSLPALQRFYHPEAYNINYPHQVAVDFEALNTPFV